MQVSGIMSLYFVKDAKITEELHLYNNVHGDLNRRIKLTSLTVEVLQSK